MPQSHLRLVVLVRTWCPYCITLTHHHTRSSHSNQTHRYDSDNDGAGHPVFANFATQIDQLEETRDLKATFYDPFRGRYAIPTKSTLGDYYATAGTDTTFDQCRAYYFEAGEATLPIDSNTVYFVRFFPRISDTASVTTMGLEAIGIIFKDVIQPSLPSLTHNVLRKTANTMVKSFLDEIRSDPATCKEPEKRYEADGKTPYLIRWGEDEHHSGEVTYSWFASELNKLINQYLSPNTAENPDSNLNTYLTSALPPNGGFPNLNRGHLYVVFTIDRWRSLV